MADNRTADARKYNMSRIGSKDTKPELAVRKYLFSKGLRYRLNVKGLPGKPDIVLTKYRTAIFVNGCFWHGHENCKYYVMPKTNSEFWESKVYYNRSRDIKSQKLLNDLGWNVITVWQCQLKNDEILIRIIDLIRKNERNEGKENKNL